MHTAGPSDRQGFTLIELMVVIVLIGIMTAMILPQMKGTYEDALLRSTGRTLMDACHLASSQAITLNQQHRVRLDLRNGRYSIERTATEGEQKGRFVPVQNVPGAEGPLDKRISIELRKPDEEPNAAPDETRPPAGDESEALPKADVFAFYPDGTADAREILLKDREGFRLGLSINATTGRVSILARERP